MAQNISLMGAIYLDTPSVRLPKDGGGFATFTDVTDTTATASDVASGKYFYAADGTRTLGTKSDSGVSVVTTQDTHGGDIVEITSSSLYGLEYLDSLYSATVKFADTSFNTWTPSSTATAMLATANVGTFTATNVNLNDYYSRFLIDINLVYTNETTAKGRLTHVVCDNWYCVTKRPNNFANMTSKTRNAVVLDATKNLWAMLYYTDASTRTLNYSQTYGIYSANQAPASSGNTNSPTITVKRPVINMRCHATYFATGQAALVDKDESTITFKHYLYKSHSPYNSKMSYESIIDVWHNGL